MVTQCRGPTKEGLGVNRPSHRRREPKSAIVTALTGDNVSRVCNQMSAYLQTEAGCEAKPLGPGHTTDEDR